MIRFTAETCRSPDPGYGLGYLAAFERGPLAAILARRGVGHWAGAGGLAGFFPIAR